MVVEEGEEEEEPEIIQFTPAHFVEFGKQMLQSICKHLVVSVTDIDRAGMITGFDLKLDSWLGKEDIVEKPKVIKKKKK